MSKRFHYDWKTGRMKDTQSNSQATSNMRVLETIINDACYFYENKIKELETRNKRQYKRLKKITDLMYKRDWERLEEMVEDWENWEKQLENW